MKTRNILFYKVFYTDRYSEISYFDSFEDATKAATAMIDSFKFWGGGAVPVTAEAARYTKAGKYKDTPHRVEYPESLYIDYARENGSKCGYLQNFKNR